MIRFLLARYFDEVSRDSGQYCFGIEETLKALEMGAVETLIVWENFDVMRYVLRNPQTQEVKILHLRSDQEKEKSHFQDKDSGVELEHVEEMPLLEWFANNYKNFGRNCLACFFRMLNFLLNSRCNTRNCHR